MQRNKIILRCSLGLGFSSLIVLNLIGIYTYEKSDCVEKCFKRFQRTNFQTFDCDFKEQQRQRVVSFSLFGVLRNIYRRGLIENSELVRRLYPGWSMRLYVASDRGDNVSLCALTCEHNIDLCLVTTNLGQLGDIWRY